MKKAWFFGDSFIHGTGCREKIDDKNKIVSQIVSEKLNLEEINLSCMGYSNENIIFSIIINLENIPQTRNEAIQTAQASFKDNFNNSNLRASIENNITENVNNIQEDIEATIDETLGDLGKEIHNNLKNKNE